MKNKLIAKIKDTETMRLLASTEYNYLFNKQTGLFCRWGKTKEDDPQFSPAGPEILDLEISTGSCLGKCKFCYKCNGENNLSENMSLETFDKIIDKFPHAKCGDKKVPLLTQVALGITDIGGNPDFFPIMRRARERGIIPNYTCHGLDVTEEVAKETAELCGAVAVSIVNKEKTYDSVKMFTDAGMTQTNLHFLLARETYDKAFEVIDDIASDPRLKGLNAIVFLQYKDKNPNANYHSLLEVTKYQNLINKCDSLGISYGFDSCSANMFIKSVENRDDAERLIQMSEPCESGLFSSYINVKGEFFVCSFSEGEGEWKQGINVLECDDFLNDVWFNDRLLQWRKTLLNLKRNCPIYNITACKQIKM